MSVVRINRFKATHGKSVDAFDFLRSLIPYISGSKGCAFCEVLQSTDNLEDFVVIERWDSVASHKKSLENYPKENLQSAMMLFAGPPSGGFYHG